MRESAARQLLDKVRPELVLVGVEVPEGRTPRGTGFWRLFEGTVAASLRFLHSSS